MRGICAGSVLKEKSKIFMYGISFARYSTRKTYTGSVLQGIRPGKLIQDQFCKVFDQENLYRIGFARYSTRKTYTGSVLRPNFYTGSVLRPHFLYGGSVLQLTKSPDFQASAHLSSLDFQASAHQNSLDFQASAHQGSKHKKAMI